MNFAYLPIELSSIIQKYLILCKYCNEIVCKDILSRCCICRNKVCYECALTCRYCKRKICRKCANYMRYTSCKHFGRRCKYICSRITRRNRLNKKYLKEKKYLGI